MCLLQRRVRCRAPPAQGPAASGPCVGQADEQERGSGLRCEQGCVPSSIVASAAVSPNAGTALVMDGGQGAAFRRQRAARELQVQFGFVLDAGFWFGFALVCLRRYLQPCLKGEGALWGTRSCLARQQHARDLLLFCMEEHHLPGQHRN